VARQAADTDRNTVFDASIWTAFQSSGLAISPIPAKFGGVDLADPRFGAELCTLLRLLGAADLSIARLFEGHLNTIGLVCRYGSAQQIEELATAVANGVGAVCGVWGADDATGLKTVNSGEGVVLQGRKILASGAGFISRPLVTSSDPEGQQMYLLSMPAGYPHDLSGWQAQGMRATATGTVDFSGMVVGEGERIGEVGDYMRQPTFSGGAWRFCAAQLGAIERLVDLFRQHLNATQRGHDPYQLQRLAACVSSAKTARFWVEEAARRFGSEMDPAQVVAFTHLTRSTVEQCALTVIKTVQRGIGLKAFIRPHDVERICRDLATYLRQPAPDLAMADGAKEFLASPLGVGDF
jgi:alkylation response protein AidB-like acyl-CoA dehydrogenase